MPYDSIAAAKKADFPTSAEGSSLTLAQINKLAEIYDAIKKAGTAKNPFSVAWTAWKKLYRKIDNDGWTEIKTAAIQFGTEQFTAAIGSRTEGVPSHAAMIKGRLIHLNKKNLKGWGVTAAAAKQIIAGMVGIPIRACNNPDPHACDFASDNFANVGYATDVMVEDEWIVAEAAITDREAAKKVNDKTWMPFGKGGWSVTGFPSDPTPDFETSGLTNGFTPDAIALIIGNGKPAFEGSGFQLVAAAIQKPVRKAWKVLWAGGRGVQFFEDEKDADHWITSGKGKKWFEFVSKTFSDVTKHDNGRSYRVHPSGTKMNFKSETVAAALTNHGDDNMAETPEDGNDPITYTQAELDKKIEEMLAKQKTDDAAELKKAADAEIAKQRETSIEELAKMKADLETKFGKLSDDEKAAYEKKIADMTSKDDMKTILDAHGKKVQADTLDTIKRTELMGEYKDVMQKSPVAGAPFMQDGTFNQEMFNAEMQTLEGMQTAALVGIVNKAKMVAAAVPGQNSFNEMQIPGTPPGSEPEGVDQKALDAMGIPSIEFV